MAQTVKNPPAMWETWVQSLGQEDPLEEGMATHSSIFAWRIPWTEEPGEPQSMRSPRVRHDWETKHTALLLLGGGVISLLVWTICNPLSPLLVFHLWEESFTSARLLKVLLSLTLFYSERGERTSNLTRQKNLEREINLVYLSNFLLSSPFLMEKTSKMRVSILDSQMLLCSSMLHVLRGQSSVPTLAEGSQHCLLIGWVTLADPGVYSGNHLSADINQLLKYQHY